MRQGQVPQHLHDLGLLRVLAFQEFAPGRGVEEELAHLHLGAGGRGIRGRLGDLAGQDREAKPGLGLKGPGDLR